MKQRLFIAAAIALGAAVLLLALGTLGAADGSSGLTLTSSHSGVFLAGLMVLILAVPAVLAGLVVSATGNPLAGVFTCAMSLLILAACGGPIDGWLRGISGPSAYRGLAFETLLWQAGLVGVIFLITRYRPMLRRAGANSNAVKTLFTANEQGHMIRLGLPDARGAAGGVVCLLVGFVLAMLLIRSSESGQVIGALLVSFTVAGICGQMVLPRESSPAAILIAPGVVGLLAYVMVWMGYSSHDELLAAWFAQTRTGAGYSDRLLSLALALPIHYASAGVAGAAIGIGLGQSIQAAELQEAQA